MSKPFEGILGDTTELRIIEFMLPLEHLAFDINDISRILEINKKEVKRAIKNLNKWKILMPAYYGEIKDKRLINICNTTNMCINTESHLLKKMNEFNLEIISILTNE